MSLPPFETWPAGFSEKFEWKAASLGSNPKEPVGGAAKRALDVVIASIALVLLLPLLLIIATLIRVVMGSPIIFSQERVGFAGRTFRCFKFRTMSTNAEEILARHLATNAEAAAEWRESQKLTNDPRVGCLANILRKSSLDELPQLVNILRGDMSLVGPRPIVTEELSRYGQHAEEYLRTRPGLTGIWQTSGRNRLSYAMRIALDCHYARSWSLWLDMILLVRTIPAVCNFDQTS